LLAQTPLSATVVDFLTLMFQEHCVAIFTFQADSDKKVCGIYVSSSDVNRAELVIYRVAISILFIP